MEKLRNRPFLPGVPYHIYQITCDGGILFYDEEDYLVFFTILATAARRLNIKVSAACLMINHIHLQATAADFNSLARLLKETFSHFAVSYNSKYGRSGHLMRTPFGFAPKDGKFFRQDNLAYILNNPVVKYICPQATDYRWNFLAYAFSTHPFSSKYFKSKASRGLNRAVAMVDWSFENGRCVSYDFCRANRQALVPDEWAQLSDYIINKYNFLDYKWIEDLYGNLEGLTGALENTRGKEPDLVEITDSRSYKSYYRMLKLAEEKNFALKHPGYPYNLTGSELKSTVRELASRTGAYSYEIANLLHITAAEVKEYLRPYR